MFASGDFIFWLGRNAEAAAVTVLPDIVCPVIKIHHLSFYVVSITQTAVYPIVERRKKEVDQKKIGSFFKELRNEKLLTQEQLAEHFGVAARTISRWETGNNMPDLDILIEMADYYDVELIELLNGERKNERMDKEMEQTVLQVADYSNEEKLKLTKRMHILFIIGLITFILYVVTTLAEPLQDSHVYDFISGVCMGFSLGTMIVGVIFTSKYVNKIMAFKMRYLFRK